MKIQVKNKHIKQALKKTDGYNSMTCPVALAINDVLKNKYFASVGQTVAGIETKKDGQLVETFELPEHIQDWIDFIDNCDDASPVEFDADIRPIFLQ